MSRELLFSVTRKDFRIDTFRSGGKGGQHQNKTDSGVRFTHIESGAVGESREARSQKDNRRNAFRRCEESSAFKRWHERKLADILVDKAAVEQKVQTALKPS